MFSNIFLRRENILKEFSLKRFLNSSATKFHWIVMQRQPRFVYTTLTDVCFHQFQHVSASILCCGKFSKMAKKIRLSIIYHFHECFFIVVRAMCQIVINFMTLTRVPPLTLPYFSRAAHCSFYGVIKGSEWKKFAVVWGEVNTWKIVNFSNHPSTTAITQSSTLVYTISLAVEVYCRSNVTRFTPVFNFGLKRARKSQNEIHF